MAEENIRTKYGLNENEMKFKKEVTGERLFDEVADDFDSIMQNPINLTLSTYEKEFMKNERLAYDMFLQLDIDVRKFYDWMEQYPSYEQMDVTKLFKDIIFKYKLFSTYLRQNILLSENKFKEAKETISNKYVTNDNLDRFRQSCLQTVEDIKKQGDEVVIKKYGDSVVAFIPTDLKSKYPIDSKVIIKPKEINFRI